MQIQQKPRQRPYAQPLQRPPTAVEQDLKELLHPPTEFVGALAEGVAWIAAATALRLGIGMVLSMSSQFWWPMVAVLMAPAAIALLLAQRFPQLSLILGYRLVLVMVGLLLGGRL